MRLKDILRFSIAAIEKRFDFLVDFAGRLFAAVALKRAIHAGEVISVLTLGRVSQPNLLAHAIDADHLPSESGRTFQVVLRAGRDFSENDFFRGAAAESAANAVNES